MKRIIHFQSGEIDTLQDRIPITLSALFEFICSVSDTQFPVVQKESKDGGTRTVSYYQKYFRKLIVWILCCLFIETQLFVFCYYSIILVKLPLIITPELRRSMEKPVGLAVSALKTLLTKYAFKIMLLYYIFCRTRCPEIVEDMNVVRAWSECLDKELFIDSVLYDLTVFIISSLLFPVSI